MSRFEVIKQDNQFQIKGDLTFFSINKKSVARLNFSDLKHEVSIDLEGVQIADSAGLAFIIELVKQNKQISLQFENIPAQLSTLADLSGLQINKGFQVL